MNLCWGISKDERKITQLSASRSPGIRHPDMIIRSAPGNVGLAHMMLRLRPMARRLSLPRSLFTSWNWSIFCIKSTCPSSHVKRLVNTGKGRHPGFLPSLLHPSYILITSLLLCCFSSPLFRRQFCRETQNTAIWQSSRWAPSARDRETWMRVSFLKNHLNTKDTKYTKGGKEPWFHGAFLRDLRVLCV